jgi:hypothetical protein
MAIDFDLLRTVAISARDFAHLRARTAPTGGTCNMDKCALDLGRHRRTTQAKVEKLFEELGIFAWRRGSGLWKGCYLLSAGVPYQGHPNTVAAEAMTQIFKDFGFKAATYYQMD